MRGLIFTSLALAFVSCAEERHEGFLTPPPVVELVDPSVPPEETHVVHRVLVDAESVKKWRITNGTSSLQDFDPGGGHDSVPGLRLKPFGDEKTCKLQIPVDLDPRTYNLAVVHMEVRGTVTIAMKLLLKGKAPILSSAQQVLTTPGTDTAQFDLMAAFRGRERYNQLVLNFRRENKHPMLLLGVDFLWTPLDTRLPSLVRDGEMGTGSVEVDGEYRACVSLSQRHPLMSSFIAPAEGDLVFSCGLPLNLRIPGSELALEFQLTSESGESVESRVVNIDTRPDKGAWLDVRVPVREHAGEALRASFELDDAKDSGGAVALSLPRFEVEMSAPPRVLLITSDTHRGDFLGEAVRSVGVQTPFLDELGARGVFFEDCFSTTNITLPSHAAIMTGLSPRDTGILGNSTALASAARTLAEHYHDAGYHTISVISSVHLAHDNSGIGQGFDRGMATKINKLGVVEAVEALEGFLEDAEYSPVFAWLHLFEAHAPYLPPEKYRFTYYDPGLSPNSPNGDPIPDHARPVWDRSIQDRWFVETQYMAEVTYLDEVLSKFASRHDLKEWTVAFTSDHGESLGGHDVYWRHVGLYPDTVAVPLILTWPGAPEGVRVSRKVMNIDIGRTLLDLSGLGAVDFPGVNLVANLEDEGRSDPRFQVGAFGHYAAMEQDNWFLILTIRPDVVPGLEEHQIELYNLSDDIECERDLVDEEFDRARRMRASLIDWLDSADASALAIGEGQMDVATLEAIQALGYAADPTASRGGGPLYTPNSKNPWCARFE